MGVGEEGERGAAVALRGSISWLLKGKARRVNYCGAAEGCYSSAIGIGQEFKIVEDAAAAGKAAKDLLPA